MFKRNITRATALALGAVLVGAPAAAQKAKDNLRIGFEDPVATVDITYDPKPETGLSATMVFDTLFEFDRDAGVPKPLLAESYKRVDPKTLEIKLKQGVKYHDGSEFDADDVVYTINWAIDPKVRLRFKRNWSWMAGAEKIDKYTVRITMKRPVAWDLVRLATNTPIYPSDVHGSFKEKSEFGSTTPIGTGPYKVVSINSDDGVVLERNPDYEHGGDLKPAGTIGRVHASPVPEMQTRIAKLLVGELDMTHNVTKDLAENYSQHPDLAVTASQGLLYYYMSMDAVDRSGIGVLKDKNVRRALIQSLDREGLAKHVVAGGEAARPMQSLCFRFQSGCDFSKEPPEYDLEAARKLLAGAGLEDGFSVEITAIPGAGNIAEAIAGELREVGVRATVDRQTFGGYRRKQGEGKIQILVGLWSSGGLPDVASTMNFFFSGTGRDYWRDETLQKWEQESNSTFDLAKRKEIGKRYFDRVNEMHYILPVTTKPSVFLHTKDLEIDEGSLIPFGAELNKMRWN